MKITVEPQSSLLDNMNDMRIRKAYCDLTFRLPDDSEFPVHKSFIAARSQYFAKMLDSDLTDRKSNVINITTFDSETLEIVIKYIYSGSIEVEFTNLDRVLHAFELMILTEPVRALDESLASMATDHFDDVVAIAASFPNLPDTNDSLAEVLCGLEEKKRTTVMEKATTAIMLKVAHHAGNSINYFFNDVIEWMKRNIESKDFWKVYATLDFNELHTTNIQELGMIGARAAIAEYDNVELLLEKVTDVIVYGRTRKICVNFDVADITTSNSTLAELGSIRWRVDVSKQFNRRTNEESLAIFFGCSPADNMHLESYSSVIFCNTAVHKNSGSTRRKTVTYTFTETDDAQILFLMSWDDLMDESHGFLADGKVRIELEILIEHSSLEWK